MQKRFTPAKFGLNARKTTSKTVRAKVVSKIRRVNPYTDDWSTISYQVRKRDGFSCVICGATFGLEVHHIIPVSKGGNNSQLNLKTLCSVCHSKMPGHEHLAKKLR